MTSLPPWAVIVLFIGAVIVVAWLAVFFETHQIQ